jgi:hypothetical protein
MEYRLTQTQLAQVVAEVERLSQQRAAELDRQQVKEILQELNLPTDLLDDALLQLQRREALANRQKRQRLIVAGIAIALVAAIATITISSQRHQEAIAEVNLIASRITVGQDNSSNPASIDPTNNPQVFYRVTLEDAPVGSRLSLGCDWIDPSGQIVHQSRYQTNAIDREVWNTYCYHSLSANAATGTWEVRMILAGRSLGSQRFVVGKP